MSSDDIDRQVRHLVGIATLRRLRRMVDGETAKDATAATWARRLTVLLTVLTVIFVAGLVLMTIRLH